MKILQHETKKGSINRKAERVRMKVYMETYGCTMNQGDSEIMLGKLEESGHEVVDKIKEADLVVLNTCAVKRPTLNRVLHRIKELKNSDKKLVIGGCLPLIDHEKIEEAEEVEGIISCLTTDQISEVINRISKGESGIEIIEGKSKKIGMPKHRQSQISAPVPIAEGCLSNCSYCSVKFARRKLRSFPPQDIVREVENELENGRKEIYITAQDTGVYGMDIGTDLSQLLEKISSIQKKFRVRVGMMNPARTRELTDRLIESYNDNKIYKFLHLPIQSGNDEILKKMRREYTVEDFLKIVKKFRANYPDMYLATDIIVGFPGETKKKFLDTCDLMKKVKPDKINLTRFTPMPGTDAERMNQVESEIKKDRSRKMTKIHHEISYEKNRGYIGRRVEGLIVKKGKKGGYEARIHNYKPVIVEDGVPGRFASIKIKDAEPTYLIGEIEEIKK